MGKLSLDQLLHTMDIVHEYSSDSNSISFEEQTLNLQIESSRPIEKSNNEENLQDDLDSTSTKTPLTKATNFGVSRFEVPANAVTRKRSRRVCCKTKMNRNKNSGTIKIKGINETLKTINKEGTKIESPQKELSNKRGRERPPKERKTENMVDEEVVKDSYTSRKSARKHSRPTKIKRVMNDKTSPKVYQEGNNEFLAVANKLSCINLTDDDDKSNEKKSALETETPEPSIVVLNSTAQIGNVLQLNKENQEDFRVRSASHSDDCHLNVEGKVVEKLDSASIELPFVKLSPLWETIKSSQLFLSMPQEPHFLPLKQYSESRREGMALGLMVTFSTVVMNTLKYRISDPGQSIEEMIDTLNDLERHGFELYNLRYVLEYLRYLKENYTWIMNEAHATNELTSDGQSNEDLLNEKLEATDKTIMELEQPKIELKDIKKSLVEEKSVKPTQVEGFDCKINKLQNDGKTIESSYPAAESSLHRAREKFDVNSIDLNVALEDLDLADTTPTDDKREESKEERVNESNLSFCEDSINKKERILTFEQVSKYFYIPITRASKELNMGLAIEDFNLAGTISTDDKREESKKESVNENNLSICEDGINKKERVLTFEQVSKYFYIPITQASKELNMGLAIEDFNLAGSISTDDKREESKEERVNENNLSICEESSNKKDRVLTFEQVSKYFYMPITQASKELNMGLTMLKKKCRELGIPRWPHRKMKSLQTLIKNVQETGGEVVGEEELKNLDKLEQEKVLMEKEPAIQMEENTKRLRQAFFKANYKKRRLQSQIVPEADAVHVRHSTY